MRVLRHSLDHTPTSGALDRIDYCVPIYHRRVRGVGRD